MTKDNKQIKKYLNIAKGQLDGIIKMIDEDRYCLDVADQLAATRSLLRKTNNLILEICHCVKESIMTNDESKVDEIIKVLEKQL